MKTFYSVIVRERNDVYNNPEVVLGTQLAEDKPNTESITCTDYVERIEWFDELSEAVIRKSELLAPSELFTLSKNPLKRFSVSLPELI
jgi:hypothetical protein